MQITNFPTNLTDKQWQVMENILDGKKGNEKGVFQIVIF